ISVTWTTLLASRDVQRHRTSKREFDDMRALVARDLADVQVAALSADRRFATAYNAALQTANMANRRVVFGREHVDEAGCSDVRRVPESFAARSTSSAGSSRPAGSCECVISDTHFEILLAQTDSLEEALFEHASFS